MQFNFPSQRKLHINGNLTSWMMFHTPLVTIVTVLYTSIGTQPRHELCSTDSEAAIETLPLFSWYMHFYVAVCTTVRRLWQCPDIIMVDIFLMSKGI